MISCLHTNGSSKGPALWVPAHLREVWTKNPAGVEAFVNEMSSDFQVLQVHGALFKVYIPSILPLAPVLATEISSSRNRDRPDDPIVLSDPPESAKHFQAFLFGVYKQPNLDARAVSLPDILLVAEMSFHYGNINGALWAMEGVRSAVNATQNRPLRFASTDTFVRLLKVAFICEDDALSHSVQSQWLCRLFRGELSPLPAIEMGSREPSRLEHLLSHAYYVHMVGLDPLLSAGQSIEVRSPLSRIQNVHVLCGYYSLSTFTAKIRECPPPFRRGRGCTSHDDCERVWTARWGVAMKNSLVGPEVDILGRLRSVVLELGRNQSLPLAMFRHCRMNALGSVTKLRETISKQLNHHFDL